MLLIADYKKIYTDIITNIYREATTAIEIYDGTKPIHIIRRTKP